MKTNAAKTEIDKTTKTKKITDLFGLDDEQINGKQIEERKSESRGGGEDRTEVNVKKKESAADWLGIRETPKKPDAKLSINVKEKLPPAGAPPWKDDILDDLLPKEKLSTKNVPIKISDQDSVVDKRTYNLSKSIKKNVDDDGDDIFDLLEDKTSTKKNGKESKKQVPKGFFDELFDDPGMKLASRQQKQDRISMFGKKDHLEGNPVFALSDKKEVDTSNVMGELINLWSRRWCTIVTKFHKLYITQKHN